MLENGVKHFAAHDDCFVSCKTRLQGRLLSWMRVPVNFVSRWKFFSLHVAVNTVGFLSRVPAMLRLQYGSQPASVAILSVAAENHHDCRHKPTDTSQNAANA